MWLRRVLVLAMMAATAVGGTQETMRGAGPKDPPVVATRSLRVGEAMVQVQFAKGIPEGSYGMILDRIERAAKAVALYYGRFPVARTRVVMVPVAGGHGVVQGTTWGDREGFPAYVRLRVGEETTREELDRDWVMTHELVHTALPSLPEDEQWLEEGLASYVEPIARVQAGELPAERIWGDMVHGMGNGEPEEGDRGLNHTHTWGRTYWGGALFCLVADIEIRRETGSRLGLQDALRAVVAAGGGIDKEWPVERVLRVGDEATGTKVLEEMYGRWSESAVPVDLPRLWERLGVREEKGRVRLDPLAPDAGLRVALTRPRSGGEGFH